MLERLERSFFERDTLQVARDLLGRQIVRTINGTRLSGLIVETEAYIGESDPACHAAKGRTARTEVMYGPPGISYVYFVYGMYHCLNVVTEREGFPAAVLVRALEPLDGIETMRCHRSERPDGDLTNGPGKLCQALSIDRRLNNVDLTTHSELFITEGRPVGETEIATSPRIGLNTPGWAAEAPWRLYVAGNPFVSGRRASPNRPRHNQD